MKVLLNISMRTVHCLPFLIGWSKYTATSSCVFVFVQYCLLLQILDFAELRNTAHKNKTLLLWILTSKAYFCMFRTYLLYSLLYSSILVVFTDNSDKLALNLTRFLLKKRTQEFLILFLFFEGRGGGLATWGWIKGEMTQL